MAKINFEVDRNIIHHIMESQSGDINSALKELIQNSFDSGSKNCKIEVSEHGFKLTDDGKGFSSIEEIQRCFGTFGTAHTPDKSKFARFRIGRGQIMSKARTEWQSSNYRMLVDVVNNGLEYELVELNEFTKGCIIEGTFYEPLNLNNLKIELDWLSRSCAYIDMNIIINGVSCGLRSSKRKVLLQGSNYTLFEKEYDYLNNSLYIYNLGMRVKVLQRREVGLSGDLVVTKSMNLNTSRNEILSNCPVWKEVLNSLKKFVSESRNLKKSNDLADIIYMLNGMYSGQLIISDFVNVKLFKGLDGSKRFSLKELSNSKVPVCFYTKKDQLVADKIDQKGLAVMLREENMPCSSSLFIEKMNEDVEAGLYIKIRNIVPLKEIVFDDNKIILEISDLSKQEAAALRALSSLNWWVARKIRGDIYFGRTIYPGYCSTDSVNGWTDGATSIVITKKSLGKIHKGLYGASHLAHVFLHELIHDTENRHMHSHEFYRYYHDIIDVDGGGFFAKCIKQLLKFYYSELKKANLKVPKAVSTIIGKA